MSTLASSIPVWPSGVRSTVVFVLRTPSIPKNTANFVQVNDKYSSAYKKQDISHKGFLLFNNYCI